MLAKKPEPLFWQQAASQVFVYNKENYLNKPDLEFDVIFDTIGNESTTSRKKILSSRGRFISTHTSGKFFREIIFSHFKSNTQKVSTLLAMPVERHLKEMGDLVEQGKLSVVVDKTFKIKDLSEAIRYSKTGRVVGKIFLDVDGCF